jgi:hypothetical protein
MVSSRFSHSWKRVPNFEDLLRTGEREREFDALRRSERTGRPLGSDAFVADLERQLGRAIAVRQPGRKPSTTIGDSIPISLISGEAVAPERE